jgi:hypothetical protein
MNASLNRDTGSDQVDTFAEIDIALSSREVPLETLSPKQAEAMRRLGDLVKLPANWDSYGSPPLSQVAVETVIDLLQRIDDRNLPAVRIVPVSGGGVQLEWRVSTRELQLEIASDGTAQYLQIEGGQPQREEEITSTADRMPPLLEWLISGTAERLAA